MTVCYLVLTLLLSFRADLFDLGCMWVHEVAKKRVIEPVRGGVESKSFEKTFGGWKLILALFFFLCVCVCVY
jgi:hypothetical protein